MTYTFKCTSCNHQWDASTCMANRDVPLSEPCVSCAASGEGIIKRMVASPGISYDGAQTVLQRAGSGWNDVLKKIQKANGRYAKKNIETR